MSDHTLQAAPSAPPSRNQPPRAATLLVVLLVAFVVAFAPAIAPTSGPEDREPSTPAPPPPAVSWTMTPAEQVQVGEAVSFDGTTTTSNDGGLSDAIWDFGDGWQAEGLTATHRYDRSGVYWVQLRAHGDGGGGATSGRWVDVQGPDLWPDSEKLLTDEGGRWPVKTTFEGRTCTMMAAVTLPVDPDDPQRRDDATFPTIVQLSPYGGNYPGSDTELFQMVRSGYAVVRSSPPGRYLSPDCEDAWNLFDGRERQAGHDLVEWVAAQPWSDGHVGMHGASAPGIEGLLTASSSPPHLDAVVVNAAYGDPYRDFIYPGGIQTTPTFVNAWMQSNLAFGDVQSGRYENALAAERTLVEVNAHRTYDDFWRERTITAYDPPAAPVLAYTANHDIWPRAWFELAAWVAPGGGRVVACPGGHGCVDTTGYTPSWGVDGFTNAQGEVRAWFDHHLKGVDNGVDERSLLSVLSTGGGDRAITTHNSGRWNDFDAYPFDEVQWQDWYLHGEAGSEPHLRTLSREDPVPGEPPSPMVPSPASGVASSGSSGFVYLPDTFGLQAYEEAQALTFETEPFAEPFHVAGPLTLELSATALSTDVAWVVRVSDVWPDGSSHFITEGYLKASHRALDEDRSLYAVDGRLVRPYHPHTEQPGEGLLTPGTTYRFPIEVWPVGNRWLPGHRMRLQLSAQSLVWHPSAEPGAAALVHTDAAHPSVLRLPVLAEGAAQTDFPHIRGITP